MSRHPSSVTSGGDGIGSGSGAASEARHSTRATVDSLLRSAVRFVPLCSMCSCPCTLLQDQPQAGLIHTYKQFGGECWWANLQLWQENCEIEPADCAQNVCEHAIHGRTIAAQVFVYVCLSARGAGGCGECAVLMQLDRSRMHTHFLNQVLSNIHRTVVHTHNPSVFLSFSSLFLISLSVSFSLSLFLSRSLTHIHTQTHT